MEKRTFIQAPSTLATDLEGLRKLRQLNPEVFEALGISGLGPETQRAVSMVANTLPLPSNLDISAVIRAWQQSLSNEAAELRSEWSVVKREVAEGATRVLGSIHDGHERMRAEQIVLMYLRIARIMEVG